MRTKTINCYQYHELTDKAKEKARGWWINASAGESFAWDNTKGDAAQIGLKLTGMDRGSMFGDFIVSAEECIKKILTEHGDGCETFKTATQYDAKFKALDKKCQDEDLDDDTNAGQDDFDKEVKETKREFLASILEDYRIMYEKDEEYQQSEEYIAETMEANEYEFYENGRRI